MRDLVAVSGKQLAGKDTFCHFLLQALPDFRQVPIARAIKSEFCALYGLTPGEIEDNKALYRPGLIALGQRRREQDQDYWLNHLLQQPGAKIVSDMRLLREYQILRLRGAFCIRLEANPATRAKRGTLVQESDPTECELDHITDWHALLQNDGTLETLHQQAKAIANQITSA